MFQYAPGCRFLFLKPKVRFLHESHKTSSAHVLTLTDTLAQQVEQLVEHASEDIEVEREQIHEVT